MLLVISSKKKPKATMRQKETVRKCTKDTNLSYFDSNPTEKRIKEKENEDLDKIYSM